MVCVHVCSAHSICQLLSVYMLVYLSALHNAGFLRKQNCRPPSQLKINHCRIGSHEFFFTSSTFLSFSPKTQWFSGRNDSVIKSLDVKSFLLNRLGRRMTWKGWASKVSVCICVGSKGGHIMLSLSSYSSYWQSTTHLC